MQKNIRNIALTGLLALVSAGCASDKNVTSVKNADERAFLGPIYRTGRTKIEIINDQPIPILQEGPYAGKGYIITGLLIEVKDVNSGEFLKITYNKDGTIKERIGTLNYFPEEIEEIIKRDTHYKSNLVIKIK